MDWSQPKEVSQVELAFPANVIGKFLPPKDDIPEEYWDGHEMTRLASHWFYHGLKGYTFVPKEGVDRTKALRQIGACLGSFEPKHEHKEAGVGYLLDLFFKEIKEPT